MPGIVHVTQTDFGIDVDPVRKLAELSVSLSCRKIPMDGYSIEIARKEHYAETYLGVNFNSGGPMCLVSETPIDGLVDLDPFGVMLREFDAYEVQNKFGCSFHEFLRYPRWLVLEIFAYLKEKIKYNDAIAAAAKSAAEKAGGANGPSIEQIMRNIRV